jgi:hypothetical protein
MPGIGRFFAATSRLALKSLSDLPADQREHPATEIVSAASS